MPVSVMTVFRWASIILIRSYPRYSKKAKDLLTSYDITPPPKVIELNVRSDGPQVQAILARLTKRNTVPNIILKVLFLHELKLRGVLIGNREVR